MKKMMIDAWVDRFNWAIEDSEGTTVGTAQTIAALRETQRREGVADVFINVKYRQNEVLPAAALYGWKTTQKAEKTDTVIYAQK